MSRMPRSEELFAFEILRRVLGADVTLHDDGSKRAMVDGLLTMPDGTLGAVEVTTLGTHLHAAGVPEVDAATFVLS